MKESLKLQREQEERKYGRMQKMSLIESPKFMYMKVFSQKRWTFHRMLYIVQILVLGIATLVLEI